MAGVEGVVVVEVAVVVVLVIEGVGASLGADSEMVGSTTVGVTFLVWSSSEEETMAGSCQAGAGVEVMGSGS